ncbi:UDP-glucose--hexose-1-phosphate uridylyltransferase [Jeotgalibacillus haloalkalitolerans]|uniref:Galactose-1-phosphate uridylyltransferase n=1 Tax=Jeotgalibacillus haloalkalitolerans TaxID=3104292 RepID=A0ABU5KJH0_9BACL|nr:UDP-glucose--hexose-1-phosphate uridylyltransferase [Jeotgalibacillus sp. HH7-29]MDZ5711238.1 UDP-glucose--hexose-1-phosphate uridylyltransferase [Jeotgalibacillus sp. HH7-29]
MISLQIERLLQFAVQKKMIETADIDYARNRILSLLKLDAPEETAVPEEQLETPVPVLNEIISWAEDYLDVTGITEKDQVDAAIMNCLMPRPSELNQTFFSLYQEDPEKATDFFYGLSQHANYIRTDRIAKNESWISETPFGELEITINLSKPEKDPAAIAAEKKAKSVSYPSCLLCKENVGYDGRANHPARQNHRIVPVTLEQEQWFFQYSPYVYYNEHAIVLSEAHKPMKVSKESFDRLLGFTEQFPHYFVGSNADLPIVGGSILSHDHFQAGHYEFPMATAPVTETFTFKGYENVEAGIVKWPMSVLRLRSEDRYELSALAGKVLDLWKRYEDPLVDILAFTDGVPHNTITPIARVREGKFEIDLVLRNNRTSDEHPGGIFHPHEELHHIKKENIGLIEVMGLAVLPGRLKEELQLTADYLANNDLNGLHQDDRTAKHAEWAQQILEKRSLSPENAINVLREETGKVFEQVLSHAGVFKQNEQGQAAFKKFLDSIND